MEFSKINGNNDLNLKKGLSVNETKVNNEKESYSIFMSDDDNGLFELCSGFDVVDLKGDTSISRISSDDSEGDSSKNDEIEHMLHSEFSEGNSNSDSIECRDDDSKDDKDGINNSTKERTIEKRKGDLSKDEAAVYTKYEEYLQAKENGEDVSLADFVHDLSDDEFKSLLSAYDYVNDGYGGMESLVSDMFGELYTQGVEPEELEVFSRISTMLSKDDKSAIVDYYKEQYPRALKKDPNKIIILDLLLDGEIDKALQLYYH